MSLLWFPPFGGRSVLAPAGDRDVTSGSASRVSSSPCATRGILFPSEGLCPSHSPTRALARRRRAPFAWLARGARSHRSSRPPGARRRPDVLRYLFDILTAKPLPDVVQIPNRSLFRQPEVCEIAQVQ